MLSYLQAKTLSPSTIFGYSIVPQFGKYIISRKCACPAAGTQQDGNLHCTTTKSDFEQHALACELGEKQDMLLQVYAFTPFHIKSLYRGGIDNSC